MTGQRVTVFLPFTATSPAELHDAIDNAFARATEPAAAPTPSAPAPDEPILLRYREAARLLGVSVSSVEALTQRSELPVVRVGGCVRIARADIEEYVARLRVRNGGVR